MAKLKDQIEAIRRELSVGRGGRLWPYPVTLEPPFTPFSYFSSGSGREEPVANWPSAATPQAEFRFLEVQPSAEDQHAPGLAEQLLVSLNPSCPLAFEALGTSGQVHLQMAASPQDAGSIAAQIEAHYPDCALIQSRDAMGCLGVQLGYARSYRLQRSHLFPLRESHRNEPYIALIGLLGKLRLGEVALFQVLFIPARQDWRGNILRLARDPFDPGKPVPSDIPQIHRKAEAKVSKPLFAVSLRLAASSQELLDRLEGSFLPQFQGEENALEPMQEAFPLDGVLNRTPYTRGMLLNAAELAALVHIPDAKTVPEALPAAGHGAVAPGLARDEILVPLGVNRHRGVETPVGISEEWLSRHVAIFGGTGYGKTNLMKFAFAPLLEPGHGMAVLDPKGDLAQGFLDLVPQHRIDDVVWFDPTDREHPPALNVLQASSQLEDETLTAELMVGLKRLFQGNAEFGPRMEWILRNAVRTLLASEGEKTLYDIPKFLEDGSYRDKVLATVRDRELREFWQRRNLSQTVIDPVLNRLASFLDRPTIKHIVAQPNRIDFHQIMRDGKIFIANLEKGVLQDTAFVLGSFILSRLQLAALARRSGERKLFPILVDEFHNLAGHGMDTESIQTFLSEARSYKAPLVMATQYVGRLNRDVVTALFGNVGTLVCLHLGQIDAQPLQRELGDFTAEDLLDLGVGEAIVRMGSAADAFNVKVPLVEAPPSHREAIIAASRERYCRSRSEVEAMLGRQQETPVQSSLHQEKAEDTPEAVEAPSQPGLTPDQWRVLEHLADHPDETVTSVYRSLGFGMWRGNKARQHLKERGLAVEVETRLGQGNRPARFLVPTMAGLRAVNKPAHGGRGGAVHRHFQEVVASHARALGYQTNTEHRLEAGGSVDVHLSRGDVLVAVEIAVHSRPSRECKNIRKCLEAGYQQVLALFLDPELLQEARSLFTRDSAEEERQRVAFLELGRFRDELR